MKSAHAVALTLAAATVTLGADGPRNAPRASVAPTASVVALEPADEVARVRAHLRRVERELQRADVSHLTGGQRAARAEHLDRLRAYAAAGTFPHNHDVPGRRVPVFVDEHGTHCAVGHLMALSGERELVRRISSAHNLARVPELADVPGVAEWLEDAGLSVEEAARIQPAYGPIIVPEDDDRRAYETATLVGAGLGGASIAWSLLADRRLEGSVWPGVIGVGLGAAQMGLGAVGVALDGDPFEGDPEIGDRFIATNFAVGALTAALGIRVLIGHDDRDEEGVILGLGASAGAPTLQLSPWLANRGEAAGVRLDVSF